MLLAWVRQVDSAGSGLVDGWIVQVSASGRTSTNSATNTSGEKNDRDFQLERKPQGCGFEFHQSVLPPLTSQWANFIRLGFATGYNFLKSFELHHSWDPLFNKLQHWRFSSSIKRIVTIFKLEILWRIVHCGLNWNMFSVFCSQGWSYDTGFSIPRHLGLNQPNVWE